MSVADVDAFVHRYATPVLKTAGYRRNRRKYMIDGPRGRRALVEFHAVVDAHRTSFQVFYGVFTPAHEQFGEDKGFPPRPWPYASFALLSTPLFSPEAARAGVRVPDHVLPQDWLLGDDEHHNAAVGAALVSSLETDVLPQIESWFDPEALVRSLENLAPGAFPGLSPLPRAVAMALLDVDGAEGRVAQTLALLPPDDMVREWIESQRALGAWTQE